MQLDSHSLQLPQAADASGLVETRHEAEGPVDEPEDLPATPESEGNEEASEAFGTSDGSDGSGDLGDLDDLGNQ